MGRVKLFCGIDPGIKGAVAFVREDGSLHSYTRMPKHLPDIKSHIVEAKPWRIFIEKQHSAPMQGVKSTFTTGMNYGILLGVLETLGFSFEVVGAKIWQKLVVGIASKSSDAKVRAFEKARRLWPTESFIPHRCTKPHDGIIDACLIAEYGRRINV